MTQVAGRPIKAGDGVVPTILTVVDATDPCDPVGVWGRLLGRSLGMAVRIVDAPRTDHTKHFCVAGRETEPSTLADLIRQTGPGCRVIVTTERDAQELLVGAREEPHPRSMVPADCVLVLVPHAQGHGRTSTPASNDLPRASVQRSTSYPLAALVARGLASDEPRRSDPLRGRILRARRRRRSV